MKKALRKLFGRKTEEKKKEAQRAKTLKPITAEKTSAPTPPDDGDMSNLIKMKEAMALIKASAPTVRKYARLGYYSEYRFGEKLVFYNKEEMLNFIMRGNYAKSN